MSWFSFLPEGSSSLFPEVEEGVHAQAPVHRLGTARPCFPSFSGPCPSYSLHPH